MPMIFYYRVTIRANIRLENNDVIMVEPYTNRVEINGAVKRPAIYELKEQRVTFRLN